MTPQDLEAKTATLRAFARAKSPDLRAHAPRVIAAAAQRVLDPQSDLHRAFVDAAHTVGFSPEMLREALENALRPLTAEELSQQLAILIQALPRIVYPEVVFHVLAGNLFVSAIESINTALLTGAGSLLRCSTADQLYPALWARAISEVAPQYQDAIAVTHWPSMETELTATACAGSDVVVAFGSDDSVAAVRALTPIRALFIPHGTKVSFAIVWAQAASGARAQLARDIAYDFSIYDQQGCLSPRALFLEHASDADTHQFLQALLEQMRIFQKTLPVAPRTLADSAALAREREEARIENALSDSCWLLTSNADHFVLATRPAHTFRLGGLNRFVDVRLFTDLEEVRTALQPYRSMIATLGTSKPAAGGLTQLAHELRINRICPVGQMQKPPLGWTHDGRQPLSDLLQFMSVES